MFDCYSKSKYLVKMVKVIYHMQNNANQKCISVRMPWQPYVKI